MTPTPAFPDPRLVDLLRQMNAGMPPWEAYKWFDTPTETFYPDPGIAGNKRIAGRSVRRVYLMIRPGGAQATCQVSMHADATGMSGFLIDRAAPLELVQSQCGALCQEEWWQIAGAGAVTVLEVLLRAWPGGDPVG